MKAEIDYRCCKGCNICIYMCPKGVYVKGKNLSDMGYFVPQVDAPEKCINHERNDGKLICELCSLSCPDLAIKWVQEE